ncbi:MAG: GAF domain-containing protein [Campylobacterota bacterium]|nr:GAF domain-containing protein [Campylobacterota bacterium]
MKYVNSYAKLADFGRDMLKQRSLEQGLPMIAGYVKGVIGADRCSIYIYDKVNDTLWTTLSDEIEKVVISADTGIAGATIKERKPLIVNAPYKDPRFHADVDKQTGYITKNIASVPVFNSGRELIGVLQLLNKEADQGELSSSQERDHLGGFDREDTRFMVFFAHYVSGYLELASLFNGDKLKH